MDEPQKPINKALIVIRVENNMVTWNCSTKELTIENLTSLILNIDLIREKLFEEYKQMVKPKEG